MSQDKVSIIMPTYNAEEFIGDAIRSVLAQDHANWELIVVNDGSTDGTGSVIASFQDPRIHAIEQENKGIGGARNAGLSLISGGFLVTLDSDDVLPPSSLSSRLKVLHENPSLSFADGTVRVMDRNLQKVLRVHSPSFNGEPISDLVRLTGRCFFGPSWMIRLSPGMELRFDENITHAEDLLFYITLAKGRKYGYTTDDVLVYRRTGESAMTDLDGLMRGYDYLFRWMRLNERIVDPVDALYFRKKTRTIAAKTYLSQGKWAKGLLFMLGARRPRNEAAPVRRKGI
jgi:teichuronic acid biosynthesis glycosyltransferase TuaG